jgi:Flp pilus assembly protein TadD
MKFAVSGVVLAGILVLASFVAVGGSGLPQPSGTQPMAAGISIDYPMRGSVFPPEISAPTVLWRDANPGATRWLVTISFGDHSKPMHLDTRGELMHMGEIDPLAGSGDDLYPLTPEQKLTHTWKPDEQTWSQIKAHSVKSPATITVAGFADHQPGTPLSSGSTTIFTSTDAVGAPIFYRDVPLILSPNTEKGTIAPLPPFAIPLIKWRLRDVSQPQSRVVMENLPTCANCHSFSQDGKTMGLDLDGPKNDKGLYALVPLAAHTTIRNENVIRWSSFQAKQGSGDPAVKRFGFMSQVSPDGRYVVTSIAPPAVGNEHQKENPDFAPGLSDRLFSTTYNNDIHFIQVFYPMRGILAFYDREEQKLRPLPGADDPHFVQTSAFWSPDGKYLIFSRAEARDPYPPGAPRPEYANDPREPQIQYDLYRIPFNQGRGGRPEPILGASRNGMSNNFPKVSPDGRWVVFVQNHNGLLMRPDSKLYIVAFAGGKARLMKCNTPLMNSWHSFSPNGHWLAFSSKGRSPYTQLMLTHIDANGNDSPAVLVENTTLANRAVNIPEFVNIPANGLEKIDPQATEFYRLFNQVYELMQHNRMQEAIPIIREAIQRDPNEAIAHMALATALSATGQESEALGEYRTSCELNPRNPSWFAHFAVSLALNGDLDAAIVNWQRALDMDPRNVEAKTDLGAALLQKGDAQTAADRLQEAVQIDPKFSEAHSYLGLALARLQRYSEAVGQLQQAIQLEPQSVEYRYNLGYVMGLSGNSAGEISAYEQAVDISGHKDWRSLSALAEAYDKAGRVTDAVTTARTALDLARNERDPQIGKELAASLDRYERDAAKGQ